MKECIRRALRTFIQAAAGYLAANLVIVVSNTDTGDYDALKMALIGLVSSAVAAGIAALMNMQACPIDKADRIQSGDDKEDDNDNGDA